MAPGPAQGITQVWGVPSPIDTVFTRCNCQGKTYIFKVRPFFPAGVCLGATGVTLGFGLGFFTGIPILEI